MCLATFDGVAAAQAAARSLLAAGRVADVEDGAAGYAGLAYDKAAEDAGVLQRRAWLPEGVEARWSGAGYNHGGALRIDYLRNRSKEEVTVVIPAGAVFSPWSDRSQQNLVVRDETSIDLAPGAKVSGLTVHAYCGNVRLAEPDDAFEVTEFVMNVDLSDQAAVWKQLVEYYTPTVTKQYTELYGLRKPRREEAPREPPLLPEGDSTWQFQDLVCFARKSNELSAGNRLGPVARVAAAATRAGCAVHLLAGSSRFVCGRPVSPEARLEAVQAALAAEGVEATAEVTEDNTGWCAAGAVVLRITVRRADVAQLLAQPGDAALAEAEPEAAEHAAWLRSVFCRTEKPAD